MTSGHEPLPTPVRRIVREAQAKLNMAQALVDGIVQLAFAPCRMPRSAEYRDGVRAALMYRTLGLPVHCPHVSGTAQADAWFAGIEEGHALWRHQVEVAAAAPGRRSAKPRPANGAPPKPGAAL